MLSAAPAPSELRDGYGGARPGFGELRLLFGELEAHRVVGTGQFGSVSLVRHLPTGRLYALKVRT